MKNKKLLFLFLLVLSTTLVFPCDLPDHFDFDVSNSEEVLYSGCYDAINKGPHIIEYILTRERADHPGVVRPSIGFTQDRDGGLLRDQLMEHGYTLPSHYDYSHSGYDRGHMAPNGDFNDTTENAIQTFFIANIWPQKPEVNRGHWLRTESRTRRLASRYGTVKVVIIVDEFTHFKVDEITVPLNFKRMVYNAESGELIYKAIIYQYSPDSDFTDAEPQPH